MGVVGGRVNGGGQLNQRLGSIRVGTCSNGHIEDGGGTSVRGPRGPSSWYNKGLSERELGAAQSELCKKY